MKHCNFSIQLSAVVACVTLSAFLPSAGAKGSEPFSVFHDMAAVRKIQPPFPKYSDVSMRTLTIRDVPYEDPKNAFRAAAEFHITRIDWSYIWFTSRELEAVKKLQSQGYSYCGSAAQHIPCWIGDRAPVDWQEIIIMTDIQGNPSIMPFIRPWKNPQLIGDISNPLYYEGHLEFFKKLIDAGCDSIQRDAANHHYLAVTTTGGGFTKTGVAGFSRWLAGNVASDTLRSLGIKDVNGFDYKEYLLAKKAPSGDDFSLKHKDPLKQYWYQYWDDVSVEFFGRLIQDIKGYAKRDIPISVNNTSFQRWDRLHLLFDFAMSELMMVSANPEHLWKRALETEELGKFQVVGSAKLLGLEVLPEEKTAMDLKVIATIYANGGLAQVPWDTFEQTRDGSGRFFGEPADYAPTFGFIRGIAPYLDGYNRAYDYSTKGILSPYVNPDSKPLEIAGTDNEVCAFVRINKQKTDNPVVVHLIDWGKSQLVSSKKGADEVWELTSGETIYEYVKGMENLKRSPGKPFELVFSPEVFRVSADSLKFKLLIPLSYDKKRHETAEREKDYSRLFSERILKNEKGPDQVCLKIPALSPWSILVIELNKGDAAQAGTFAEVAQPRVLPAGTPKASDVSIRSLSPRRRSDGNPHDTIEAVKNFHATRLDWTYGMNEEFIGKVRSLHCTVQGTIAMAGYVNPDTVSTNDSNEYPGVDQPGGPAFEELSILDLDGMPVIAPWMRTWNFRALWGCINNPLAQAEHLRAVKKLIDIGIDLIQQDCPEMNHQPRFWGACFCDHCMIKFRGFLQSQNLTPEKLKEFGIDDLCTFSYRDLLKQQNAPVAKSVVNFKDTNEELKQLFFSFQAQASAEFHRWWRNELNEYAGHYVTVSCNNYFGWDQPYYRVFDFGLRELKAEAADPSELYKRILYAAELGKPQLFTMPIRDDQAETPEWIELTNKTLATLYAIGSWMQAPWDTYMGGTTPRYFASPEDHAHLYAMVRACAIYLDDYEDAAAAGPGIDDLRWSEDNPIKINNGSGKVYAFARAIPGEADKPIVIHLIDWAQKPEPFTLSVDPNACFGDRKVNIRLVTPMSYDKKAHETAWETKNYQPLVTWTQISKSLSTPINIPALSPWGILIIELDK